MTLFVEFWEIQMKPRLDASPSLFLFNTCLFVEYLIHPSKASCQMAPPTRSWGLPEVSALSPQVQTPLPSSFMLIICSRRRDFYSQTHTEAVLAETG